MSNRLSTLITCVGLLFLTPTLVFQENLNAQDTIDLFSYFESMGTDIPTIKIETDFGNLVKKKIKEEEQDAIVSFVGPDGNELTFNTSIRARGNVRKQVCKNPPVKINFKKKELVNAGFSRLDELKLVLQCQGNNTGVEYLLKERFIYDLYKVIDKNSVKAQLVNLEFWKEGKLDKEFQGFVVEDEAHLAKRLDAIILESGNIRSSSLQRDHYLNMSFFQYMIANTDWAIPNKHNVEIVKLAEYPRVVAIPYDFDYSGFVGTSYAVPAPSLPIENVQMRYYMGFEVNLDEAKQAAEYFKTKKQDFLDVVDASPYLDDGMKKDARNYIEKFYESLKSEKRLKRSFVTVGRR